jgi:hypothetical protein
MRKAIVILISVLTVTVMGCSSKVAVCDGSIHTVRSGDTIVAIAQLHCTNNIEVAIDQLVLQYGSDITPGQLIQLPGNE